MQYRRLGRTDLQAYYLNLGASALGGVFEEIDPAQGINPVRKKHNILPLTALVKSILLSSLLLSLHDSLACAAYCTIAVPPWR